MHKRSSWAFDVLLNKGVIIRWQKMAALVAVNGGLQSANIDCLLYTTIMPVLVARRKNGKVTAPEMPTVQLLLKILDKK